MKTAILFKTILHFKIKFLNYHNDLNHYVWFVVFCISSKLFYLKYHCSSLTHLPFFIRFYFNNSFHKMKKKFPLSSKRENFFFNSISRLSQFIVAILLLSQFSKLFFPTNLNYFS